MSSQRSHIQGYNESDILQKLISIHTKFIQELLLLPDTVEDRKVVSCDIINSHNKIIVIILTRSKTSTSTSDPNTRSYHITYSITPDYNPIHIKTERCAPQHSRLDHKQYTQIEFTDMIMPKGNHMLNMNRDHLGNPIVRDMDNPELKSQIQFLSILHERDNELINLANRYVSFMNNSNNNWCDETKRNNTTILTGTPPKIEPSDPIKKQ